MELMEKQRYKVTEVGMIPEDWSVLSIDVLTENGGLIRGPFGGALKKEYFVRDGYKVYEQKNAIYKSIEIGNYYVDELKFRELKRFEINEGDFILSCSGTIGRIYKIPRIFKKGIINQALLIIRLNQSKIYSDYFYHQFVDDSFQKMVIDDTQGGAMKNLVGMSEFRKALIPIPSSLEEQKAIATALSDVDELIANLDKLITKKKAIKQAAMQQLLTPPHKGGKRLEGFDWEWKEIKLGEVSQMNSGGTPSSKISEFYDGEINWVSITDISNAGKFIYSSSKKITEKGLENSSARLFPVNTLLLAMYASIGKCTIAKEEVTTSQAILGITVQKSLDTEFLYYYFIHKKNELINQGQQGTQANLNKGMVQDIKLFLPNIEEQKAISEILSDMDLEIEQLETKKSKYQSVKQGMMQELLTGKTRLI